jgi:hypothetical protein
MQAPFTCTNCDSAASESYCAHCGQKKFSRDDLRFTNSVRAFLSEVFDLESALGKTLRLLVTRPGKLTREFLSGKQKSYVSPVKLYLMVIAVNFLVYAHLDDYSLINVGFLKRLGQHITVLQQILERAHQRSGLGTEEFYHLVNGRVNDILPILLYFLIFALALVLTLQFSAYKLYYVEHLIFALHFMSFGFLRDVALLPLQWVSAPVTFGVSILTTLVYLFLALRKVYGLQTKALFWNTLLCYGVFFILFTVTIAGAVLLALQF